MKNILKGLILSAALVGIYSGCKKEFLERDNPNAISAQTFYETEEDATRAVNGAYAALQHFGLYHRFYHMTTDLVGDEVSTTGGAAQQWRDMKTGAANADNELPRELWESCYQGIRRCNLVLKHVPGIAMDATTRDRIVGEAKFLRALYNFHLVINFGDVPLINEVVELDSPENLKFPTRTPASQVYAQIITDLQEAEAVLPKKSQYATSDAGRATQGAAKALLGKVYLYTQQYSLAATKLNEVITSNEYGLVPEYRDNHTATNENNIESVFEVQFAAGFGHPWCVDQGGDCDGGGEGHLRGMEFGNWRNGIPSPFYLAEFEAGDPRFLKSVHGPGSTWGGVPYFKETAPVGKFQEFAGYDIGTDTYADSLAGFTMRKYVDDDASEDGNGSDVNIRIIRYADVLLMYSEALNESGGANPEVPLNQVRNRPGVTMPAVTYVSQAQMRLAIMHERVVELGLEGHRLHDLRRWYKAGWITELQLRTFLGLPAGSIPKYLYLPIPQAERDTNPNLSQNTDW